MLFIPSFPAQGKQVLTVYFPTHFTTVIRSGENEVFIVCFPEYVNAMKTLHSTMAFLQEHYTEKHAIFPSVFPCFPERSNIIFSKCFLVRENVVKTRCLPSIFLQEHFTDKHVVFLSVFCCILTRYFASAFRTQAEETPSTSIF